MDTSTLWGLLKGYVQDAQPGGLLNPEVPKGGPTELAKGLLGFTPVVGDAISAYDAVQSARQGDWAGAALNGVGVLPFVPSLAGMVKAEDKIPWGTIREKIPEKLWHMTPWEFGKLQESGKLQQATGKFTKEESLLKTPLELGEYNKYSPADIAHFYTQRAGGNYSDGWQDMMRDAISIGRDVPEVLPYSWNLPKMQKAWNKANK